MASFPALSATPVRELTRELTLAQAQKMALTYNTAINAARFGLEGAHADIAVASEIPNPQFSVNASSISFHDGVGSGAPWEKRVDSIARIDQQIERGNKRRLRTAAAAAEERASYADVEDAVRTNKLAIAQAYFELKRAQETVRIAAELFSLEQQSLTAAQRRLKTGDIANVDVARLEIEVARAQADASNAQTARATAQLQLALAIGIEPGIETGDELLATDDWPTIEQPRSIDATIPSIEQRADVRAAQAREAKAQTNVELARSLRSHDVTFGVQYERNLTGVDSPNMWGVGVSVPLFVWHRYQGEMGRALADRRIAAETLRQNRLAALTDIQRAAAELRGASERLNVYQMEIIARAKNAASAAEYAYSRGSLGLTDLLDARRSMQAVLIDVVNAQTDYAKAKAAWQAAVDAAHPNLALGGQPSGQR